MQLLCHQRIKAPQFCLLLFLLTFISLNAGSEQLIRKIRRPKKDSQSGSSSNRIWVHSRPRDSAKTFFSSSQKDSFLVKSNPFLGHSSKLGDPAKTVSSLSRSKRDNNVLMVKCPSCFAVCDDMADCLAHCKDANVSLAEGGYCSAPYCISRLDSFTEDGYFMVRMGCTNRPPSTLGSKKNARNGGKSSNSNFKSTNSNLHSNDVSKISPKIGSGTDASAKSSDSAASTKNGDSKIGGTSSSNHSMTQETSNTGEAWCYTSGGVYSPIEICVCRSRDYCTINDQDSILERPRMRRPTHRCCIVAPELYTANWEQSCPDECEGAHCITDFLAKRKQCGMDLADFHPDIRPDFDPAASLDPGAQICLQYEVAGREHKLHRCVCTGKYCNERVQPPDFGWWAPDGGKDDSISTVECYSCHFTGPREAVMRRDWPCNSTCRGHYCVISLQTAQLVQYYDEAADEASLPEMEPDYFDLHTGCIKVNRPNLIQSSGCHVEWMRTDQPFMARCACAEPRCNSLKLLTGHVANSMHLSPDWWPQPGVGPAGDGLKTTRRASSSSSAQQADEASAAGAAAIPTSESIVVNFDVSQHADQDSVTHAASSSNRGDLPLEVPPHLHTPSPARRRPVNPSDEGDERNLLNSASLSHHGPTAEPPKNGKPGTTPFPDHTLSDHGTVRKLRPIDHAGGKGVTGDRGISATRKPVLSGDSIADGSKASEVAGSNPTTDNAGEGGNDKPLVIKPPSTSTLALTTTPAIAVAPGDVSDTSNKDAQSSVNKNDRKLNWPSNDAVADRKKNTAIPDLDDDRKDWDKLSGDTLQDPQTKTRIRVSEKSRVITAAHDNTSKRHNHASNRYRNSFIVFLSTLCFHFLFLALFCSF